MPRTLTPEMLAAITSDLTRPVLFIETELATQGPDRIWTGVGPTTWNGQVWSGIGQLLSIEPVHETTDTVPTGLTAVFIADPNKINQAFNELQPGNSVQCWLGMLTASGAVTADPTMMISAQINVPIVEEGADTARIVLTIENDLIDLKRSRERRYTPEDHKSDFPGDTSHDRVPSLQDRTVEWKP